jgi:hypothetical protein
MSARYPSGRPSNMGQENSTLAQQSLNISAGAPRVTSTHVSFLSVFLTSGYHEVKPSIMMIKIGKRSDRLIMCSGFAQASTQPLRTECGQPY